MYGTALTILSTENDQYLLTMVKNYSAMRIILRVMKSLVFFELCNIFTVVVRIINQCYKLVFREKLLS